MLILQRSGLDLGIKIGEFDIIPGFSKIYPKKSKFSLE